MKSRIIQITLMATATLFVLACSSVVKRGTAKASYNSEKGTISVSLENLAPCNYVLKINEYEIGTGTINDKAELNILKQLKSKADIKKDIAMLAAKNNNEVKISLSLTDVMDTTFTYHLIPSVTMPDDNVQFSGVGAKVVSKSASRNVDDELKRWLYHKHEVVNESLFGALRANYLYLTDSKSNDFIIKGEIPILHSISGNKYNVISALHADYYAVVACNNQAFIDKFVENSVVGDYKNLSTSKSSLTCVSQKMESGYLCLILLGINRDYTYQQVPFALVALDNTAPSERYYPGENASTLTFKNGTRVIIPGNAPSIYGGGIVTVPHWAGNGLECNVTFSLAFLGDCKSITIQRRGELCYREYGGTYYFKQEDKTFYAKDYNGSHQFTWKMHFDDGDNEIPVIVEDYHGNRSSYKVIVRARFVRNNAPQINIDNNIENNIYE